MTTDSSSTIQDLQLENARLQAELQRVSDTLAATESRHQLISRAINSVVIDWNLLTKEYHRVNTVESILGYNREDVVPSVEWTRSILHPEDLPRFDSSMAAWFQGNSDELNLELRCLHKDGSYRMIRGRAVMLRDAKTQRPLRIVASYRDVSPEYQALHALELSEERYRLAAEAMQGTIFDWRVPDSILFHSTGVEKLFGESPDSPEDAQRWWQERLHPDERQDLLLKLNQFVQGNGSHGEFYYRFRHRDGHYVHVQYICIVIRNANGQAERVVGSLLDVTSRHQADQARREAEHNFQQLFQDIPLGLVVLDPQLRIIECNTAFAAMLRYSTLEMVGMHVSQIVVQSEWTDLPSRNSADPNHSHEYSWRKKLIRKDQSLVPVHIRGKFIQYRDFGQPCHFGIVENLTDQVNAEQEKQKLERHLQETQKLESLGVLAGGIAHDFNNLLTVILGNLSLLKQEINQKSPHHGALTQAEDAGTQAAELCRQMLAYAGRGKLQNKPFNISELVETSRALLGSAASRHHPLHFHLSKGLPSIAGDPSQIRQILLNLVHNAAEAIPQSGGVIDVFTGVSPLMENELHHCLFRSDHSAGDYVWLEVRDTGCGMNEATSKRIFEPFYTTKFTGRGLGLAAVAGIVRNHRGLLQYHSQPGVGTWFRIYFPLDPSASQSLTPLGPVGPAQPLRKEHGTVLVVDDEPSVRVVLARLLAKHGFAVIEAENGNEALEMVERYAHTLRLIILDLTMPLRDGMSTLQELRRLKVPTPVVVISGYYSSELIPRLDSLQAQFVSKPFTVQGLMDVIHPYLAGKNADMK